MAIELKGRLGEESLGEIFALLEEHDIACSFLVSDGVSEKIFYFSIGGIRMVSLGGRKSARVGEILVQRGKLIQSQFDQVKEYAKEGGKRFGDAALDLGFVRRDDVDAAVRSQVEGELCDLFLWPEAEFEFSEGQPPPQFYDSRYRACSISVDVRDFIEGVLERRQQWSVNRTKVGSDRDVFAPTDRGREIKQIGAEDVTSQVLSLLDGKRRVRDLIEDSGLNALTVYESLFSLLDDELIQKVRGHDTQELGREEILEEIERLEASRSEMMGDLIVRTRLAKAYEQISEGAKAAAIWKEIGHGHRRRNDLKRALEAFKSAARNLPDDFNTQEKILEIYRATGEKAKLLEEGRALAERLFKNNLLNRARQLLGTLVHLAPEDTRVRKLFALTSIGLGDTQVALLHLKELAAILERQGGRKEELKEVYRRILALDRGDRIVRGKLLAVTGQRRRVWVSRAVIAGAAVLLIVAGVSFAYELSARNTYAGEGIELDSLLARNDFDGARTLVRDLQARFGYSTVSGRIEELKGRIDDREKQYLESGLESDRRLAATLYESGDFDGAREVFERIRAGADPDKSATAREAWEEAERFLTKESRAAALLERARKLADGGRWLEAHDRYREVWERFKHTRSAHEVLFPVKVNPVPADATVLVDGEEYPGKGPRIVHYSAHGKSRIRVERPGFEPYARDTEGVIDPFELGVVLKKETRWVFEGEGPFESTPAIHEGALFVAGRDRYLYALDVADGSLRYRVSLGIFGDVESSPVVVDGVVVVATSGGTVVGIDETYGRVKWRRQVGPSVRADLVADRANSAVYVAETGGRILALAPRTGEVRWAATADTGTSNAPLLVGDLLYVGSHDHKRLTALAVADGSADWVLPLPVRVSCSPALLGTRILVAGTDGKIYSVHAGSESISLVGSAGIVQSRPAVTDRYAFVGSMDGVFYCFAVGSNSVKEWEKHLGKPILADAALSTSSVYVGSTDGSLYCLNRSDGNIRWIYETGDKIVARPLLHEGTLYVPSMDGKVYAVREYE